MTRKKADRFAALAMTIALALIMWGVVCNFVSGPDYKSLVRQAVGTSAVGLVLLVIVWLRTSWIGRTSCCLLGSVAGWTLLDAGGRRLLELW